MKETLKHYKVPSLNETLEMFEEDLAYCSENIQAKVKSILKKHSKEQFLKDLIKKYGKIKQIDEENIIDLFLLEYDTKNKPYLNNIYLKVRKELLKTISPYEMLCIESANRNFYEFYTKIVIKKKDRFLKILYKINSLEGPDDYDNFLKLISDEKWYTLSDTGFNDVILTIDESTAKVTPKIMKKILHDFKEKTD